MKQLLRSSTISLSAVVAVFLCLLAFTVLVITSRANAQTEGQKDSGSVLTIHDRGIEKATITTAKTIGEALKNAGIELNDQDIVEPAVEQEIVAEQYSVNIYRARPVMVIDGDVKRSVFSPYQTAEQIAASVDIQLYPEDDTTLTRSENIVADGVGLELTIDRAVPINFMLYGSERVVRTQATTVGDMLKEKEITLGPDDKLSVDASTPITANMSLRLWREGKQTITVDEAIAFPVTQIRDANQPIGFKQVQTAGQNGNESVTYEVVIQDGQEVSRTKIAGVVTAQPSEQVEIVGAKSNGGLTQSKGVNTFVDSKGVAHRETYYDLNMSTVMRNCGQGGVYSVRGDGVKIDSAGYVIIAANLANYPRCSIVETSLGLGKVYDTGGFASVHPHGWDIATDWSNRNGI